MAGARSRLHKATDSASSASPRRSTRSVRGHHDAEVPEIFQDLLSDAATSKAGEDEDGKPLKRRKVAGSTRRTASLTGDSSHHASASRPEPPPQSHIPPPASASGAAKPPQDGRVLQTIEDSDESDDSDMEWEDALGEGDDDDDDDDDDDGDNEMANDAEPEVGDLSITIGGDGSKEKEPTKKVKRRGITSVDKKRRLDIHKMHVLCLLYHAHRRNAWCNDSRVQAALRKLPSPKTLLNLVPNPEYTQYQASKRFIEGMQELKSLWSTPVLSHSSRHPQAAMA